MSAVIGGSEIGGGAELAKEERNAGMDTLGGAVDSPERVSFSLRIFVNF